MLRAVLLDVDGTLIDSNDAQARSWSEAFAEAGVAADFSEIRRCIGMGGDRLLDRVAGLDDEREPGKTISTRRREILLARYATGLQPTRGGRELVAWLRDCGLRIVIATAATSEELGPLLRAARVEEFVDVRVTGDDAERSKPAPDIVLAALKKSGTNADEAVMIGDTPYDVAAAGAAGVIPIGLCCGGWSGAELAPAATFADPADLVERYRESPLRNCRVPASAPVTSSA